MSKVLFQSVHELQPLLPPIPAPCLFYMLLLEGGPLSSADGGFPGSGGHFSSNVLVPTFYTLQSALFLFLCLQSMLA